MQMRKSLSVALCLGLLIGTASLLLAAGGKRASPHEQATVTLNGKKLTIEYGRPFMNKRVIFGSLVPWGQVWRTGADEATTLTTDADLTIGTLKVPKGTYALFTVPTEKEWTLIVNKVAKQWGAFKYNDKQDLGRTAMKVAASPSPVEQFTIALEPQADNKSAVLKMSWEKTVVTVPVALR